MGKEIDVEGMNTIIESKRWARLIRKASTTRLKESEEPLKAIFAPHGPCEGGIIVTKELPLPQLIVLSTINEVDRVGAMGKHRENHDLDLFEGVHALQLFSCLDVLKLHQCSRPESFVKRYIKKSSSLCLVVIHSIKTLR
jgi:hypothetical protein